MSFNCAAMDGKQHEVSAVCDVPFSLWWLVWLSAMITNQMFNQMFVWVDLGVDNG